MTAIDYISIGLLMLMGYIIVYSIINRICCCVEKCALSKSYSNFLSSSAEIKPIDIDHITGKTKQKENP